MMSRRTSGSPPVMRSLRTPRATKARAEPVEFLQRQQVLLRQERHVLGHAVDAAEVAAVGHRDAQIGDRAAERIDERRLAQPAGGRQYGGRQIETLQVGPGLPAGRRQPYGTDCRTPARSIWRRLFHPFIWIPRRQLREGAAQEKLKTMNQRRHWPTETTPGEDRRTLHRRLRGRVVASILPAEYLRVMSPSAEVQGHDRGGQQDRTRQAGRRDHCRSSPSAIMPCGSSSTTCTIPDCSPGTIFMHWAEIQREGGRAILRNLRPRA